MSDNPDELKLIYEMLVAAKKYSLEIEAIWSFGQARAAGSEVGDACAFALREWDL